MTHEPESGIEPAVADWFRERYGDGNVETQVYLPDVYWFCDVVVDCGWCALYVEVENDGSSVRPGAGQAGAYAATDPIGTPMVVVPAGHVRPERAEAIADGTGVLVREFDEAAGAFV